MDIVHFALEGLGTEAEIAIRVNGLLLQELAGEIERPYAEAEGHPNLAGDYAGLPPSLADGSASHFFGEPQAVWFEDGDTVLLGCPCGEWDCWPLTVSVVVSDATVRWSHFRNGHRDWDLKDLGPFEFDRAQYEAALRGLGEQRPR